MIIQNENAFFAYLSLYYDKPHWKFFFPYENGVYELPVGVIVFFFLNRINRIKDDGQMDFSKYDSRIVKQIKAKNYDKEVWHSCYDELISVLENLSVMDESEKYRAYKIYCQLAYFLVNNFDWQEWMFGVKSVNKTDEIINTNYKLSDVILFRGNRIDMKGLPYACYEVAGFEYLFILDLWEMMFNPKAEILVKQCKYCKDFFFTNTNQRKYCSDCTEPKQYNRIKNAKQKKDESKRYCKLITDILYRRDERGTELQAFLNENQYYKDILKGRQVEPNSDYQDIKTEAEYLSWLKKYHAMIKRKRGRKHGETDETSKRNGSDHESQGKT